ncbi:hypothetical protein [Amycolatopsis sp. GA6-003]|uniref:hypothetical protein n=1 Tax=Amycolatopsis sp. GA6-003 TaxID=2652444 RepID=UPI00391756DE
MIPRHNGDFSATIPDEASFWTPTDDDVTEEGIGFFRGTWLIYEIGEAEAEALLSEDMKLVKLVDSVAQTPEEYDRICSIIENESGDSEILESLKTTGRYNLIEDHIPHEDDPSPLDGLEIGVAGVVYALSAAGFLTAASCRGHTSSNSWSTGPVVFAATDRRHAELLAPIAARSGCGFAWDSSREDLLAIEAPSVSEMLSLANAVLMEVRSFGPPVYQMGDESRDMYGL